MDPSAQNSLINLVYIMMLLSTGANAAARLRVVDDGTRLSFDAVRPKGIGKHLCVGAIQVGCTSCISLTH